MALRTDNRVMTYRGILKRQNIDNLNRSFDTGFYEVSPSEVDPSIGFPALEFTTEDLVDTLFPYIAKSSNKHAIEKDVNFSTTYLSKIIKHYTENKNYCSGMLEIISDDDMAIQTFHRLPDGLVSERTYDKLTGTWSEWVMEVPTVVKQFRKNPYTLKEIREKILDKYNMSGSFLSSLLGIKGDLQAGLDELFAKEDHLDFAYNYDFYSKLYFVPGYVKWYFYSIVDIGYGVTINGTTNTSQFERPSWFPKGDLEYRLLDGQIAPIKTSSRDNSEFRNYFNSIEEIHYTNGDLANRISKDYGISNIYHHFFNTHNKWSMSNMVINIKEKISTKINTFLDNRLRKERESTFSLAKISGKASSNEKGNTDYTFTHTTVEDVKEDATLKNLIINQSRQDYIKIETRVHLGQDIRTQVVDCYGLALYKGDLSIPVEEETGINQTDYRMIVPRDSIRYIHLRPRVNSLFHENYGLRENYCYIPQINYNLDLYNYDWTDFSKSYNLTRPGKDFYNNHTDGLSDTLDIPIHEDNWFRINLPQFITVGYLSDNKSQYDLNRPIYVQYFSSYNDLKFKKMIVSSYEKHFVINNGNYSVVDPIEFNFVAGNQYKYGMLPLYKGNTLNETTGEWSLGTDNRDSLITKTNNFIIPGYEPWGNSLIFPSNKTHNKAEDDNAHPYDKGHSKIIVNNRCKPFVIDGYILKGQVITKSSLDRSEPLVSNLSVRNGGTMVVPIKKYQKVYQYLNRDIRTFDTRELDNIISAIEIEFVLENGLQYILFLRPGKYYRYSNGLFEYRSKDNNWDEIEFRGIIADDYYRGFNEYSVSIYTREYIL